MEEEYHVERRKYARLSIMSKIIYSIIEDEGDSDAPKEQYIAYGKNIGVAGILFSADQELAVDTKIDMEIYLPDQSEPIRMKGEVRWCHPVKEDSTGRVHFDTGVKFLSFDRNHVILLVKYVCGNMEEGIMGQLHDEGSGED